MGVKMIKISEFKGTLEAKDFLITLKTLLFNNKDKYLVILDNAPIHTADEVTKWIDSKENNNRIVLLYLQKYDSKMNRAEYFNWSTLTMSSRQRSEKKCQDVQRNW